MTRAAGTLAIAIAATAGPAAAPAGATPAEDQMIQELNEVRADRGLRKLRFSPSLRRSARRYSRQMLARDRFGHQASPRMSRRFSPRGEVLANNEGSNPDVVATVQRWLRSSSHRAVILNRSMRYVGAGAATGDYRRATATLWTVHFGGARR
jgi:uncharacterized protein YkwD